MTQPGETYTPPTLREELEKRSRTLRSQATYNDEEASLLLGKHRAAVRAAEEQRALAEEYEAVIAGLK
jgi:hypothetical protein